MALARLHALALATLRHPDSAKHREYLDALSDYAPDAEPLVASDARSDEALAAGLEGPAARRFAARLRGVVLGAAAHSDTVAREACALARTAVENEGVSAKEIDARAKAAFEATRADLERDVVRLGSVGDAPRGAQFGAWVRKWGVVRSLELNAFAATFTRDGTHAKATRATSDQRDDAGAFRFALAVTQAAMSLTREEEVGGSLEEDARRVEAAIVPLIANVIAAGR
jgi:hypothetical protein